MTGANALPLAQLRGARTTTTTMMLAKLASAAGETLCRVRNLSDGGMMIEAAGCYSPGDALALELRNGVHIHGKVIWARGGRIGLQFDEPARVADLLAPPLKPVSRIRRTQMPRPARFAVSLQIVLIDSLYSRVVELCDISQGGVRVRLGAGTPRPVGETVQLKIPDLGDKRAIVRWAATEAGLSFVVPLSFEVFSPWLSARTLRSGQPV